MTEVKIIRIHNGPNGDKQDVKIFHNCPQYEKLKVGDVVEVECVDGLIQDYLVIEVHWEFGHFGNEVIITIKPVSNNA